MNLQRTGNFSCISVDFYNKQHQLFVFYISIMLNIYISLGYDGAWNMVVERGLRCDIETVTSRELSNMRVSYRLAIYRKFIRGGKCHLDRFLGKLIPYPFITMFEGFRPDIDCNEDDFKILNRYYLAKVNWNIFLRQYIAGTFEVGDFSTLVSYYQQYLLCPHSFNELLDQFVKKGRKVSL